MLKVDLEPHNPGLHPPSRQPFLLVYAETYFNEAIASYMASLGSTDPKTITAYQELSQVMAALDRPSVRAFVLRWPQRRFMNTV